MKQYYKKSRSNPSHNLLKNGGIFENPKHKKMNDVIINGDVTYNFYSNAPQIETPKKKIDWSKVWATLGSTMIAIKAIAEYFKLK